MTKKSQRASQRAYYRGFIESWKAQERFHLLSCSEDAYSYIEKRKGKESADSMRKYDKKKLKRIRWNITRAKNLLKSVN